MTFWLVNSGQVGAPLSAAPGGIRAGFEEWESTHGPVHGLDRAYRMAPGDVLVHRSVGTAPSRLVAVGTVVARPENTTVGQWPFQVRREITLLVATLRDAPRFELLETAPIRMTKRLDEATGQKAVELIEAAARG
jgi:hypothetical protein